MKINPDQRSLLHYAQVTLRQKEEQAMSFRFFLQPKSCSGLASRKPGDILTATAAKQLRHSRALEHGLTWLSEEEAFPVVTQGFATAGPFLQHVHAHV